MKIIQTLMLAVIALFTVACGDKPTTTETTTTTANTNEYVSPLPSTAPVVKVVTTGTMPPFSFQDEYGNMMGIDIDVIRAIGEEKGFRVEFYQEPFAKLFDAVESGQRDLAISGISYNPERAMKYSLSDSYFLNPSAVMYKDPAMQTQGLMNLRQLAGKRVGAMEGAKQYDQMLAVGGYKELVAYPSTFLLYEALMQDKIDAFLQDEPMQKYTALNYPQYKTYVTAYESDSDPSSQQVIMIAKNNTKLLAQINDGIGKIKANGKLGQIEQKWLSAQK